jgi:hypothetical protein
MRKMAQDIRYGRNVRKVVLGIAVMVPLLVGVALIPSVASSKDEPVADRTTHGHTAREHAAHLADEAAVQDDLAQVRRATAPFHRVAAAVEAGYELGWVNGSGVRIVAGCVSHPTAGAMGYHYFNAALMADNAVDVRRPEVLVYAPAPDGGLKLVAVEWVVRSAQSNPPGVSTPPSVLGMEMHILVPPPGPAFYLMHAWVWDHNPAGIFADWNPTVSCT